MPQHDRYYAAADVKRKRGNAMEYIAAIGFVVISILAYNREERINRFLSLHRRTKQILPFLICFIISFFFVIKLHLSPFNNLELYPDSSVFLYIGKYMHDGMIPYRDLFDHKGVILYFIEYIGCIFGFGNGIGVWIIELFNMFVSAIIFYLIAKLLTSSRIICYAVVYIIISLCSFKFYQGGNLVEEYALPWISISLYIVTNFFITKKIKKWQIITLGISFAVVFFLRVNMVGLWGALLLSVIIYLIKTKRITDLFICSLLFIVGCLIVSIPVFVYLSATDSLKNMIEYYFVFNFAYTGSNSKNEIISFILNCLYSAGISCVFIVFSLVVYRKNKIMWLNFITLLFAFLSSAISGRSYRHYGIILIPFFVIPAVYTMIPVMGKIKKISLSINRKSVLAAIIFVCVFCVVLDPAKYLINNINAGKSIDSINEYLCSDTTKEDDVLVLGNKVLTYINSDRHTKNKFFYQVPPIDVSDKLYQEFISELESNPSDYIINLSVSDSSDSEQESENSANHQKVIEYLDGECEKGIYTLEKYDDFQVYVRK